MPFSRGDRVRCIDPQVGLTRGVVYTVSAISQNIRGDIWFCMVEGLTHEYFQNRFELVDQPPPVVEAPVGEEVSVYLITFRTGPGGRPDHILKPNVEQANEWIRRAEQAGYTILKKQKITFNL